jgi:DNA-binding GntR family transcriptional regulator
MLMQPIALPPSLVEQTYDAILAELCEGRLTAGTHLVQTQLAARLGVSRQPVQQALLLLRNDGLVEEAGGRGLIVAPLDLTRIRQHYQIRAALDALAVRLAALRCAASAELADRLRVQGRALIAAAEAAMAAGSVTDLIAQDIAFHAALYRASGNPLIEPATQVHWRYLRRAMGEVLRKAEPPPAIWQQHGAILDAVVQGDAKASEDLAQNHVEVAARCLAEGLAQGGPSEADDEREHQRVEPGVIDLRERRKEPAVEGTPS